MPPLVFNSLVTFSLTFPDKKNFQPSKSASGFCAPFAGNSRPGSADAEDVIATLGEGTIFVAIVVEAVTIEFDVDSGLLVTPKRPDPSVEGNVVTAKILVELTMEVGVMVSIEAVGVDSEDAAALMEEESRISPAVLAIVAGDGVIVSDDGAEIAVAIGGVDILACVADTPPSPLTPEDAAAEFVTLCPCPLSSDRITEDVGGGGGGGDGCVALNSEWG